MGVTSQGDSVVSAKAESDVKPVAEVRTKASLSADADAVADYSIKGLLEKASDSLGVAF